MKLIQEEGIHLTNSTAEVHEFELADPRILMELLSKLYAHPKQTMVQEYLCNARDAHRESGATQQIEVWGPTTASPNFVVRDYGPGLSEERLKNIFFKYGKSTKRNNNQQTGGFGIGAKSFAAYTDSMLVETYYNGTYSAWTCFKDSDRLIKGTCDQTMPTEEPNGVRITIAIDPQDIADISTAIRRCVYFWEKDEQPLLHNVPEKQLEGYELNQLSGPLHTYKPDIPNFIGPSKQGIVVLDGIPYPLNSTLIKNIPVFQEFQKRARGVLVLFAETGDLEIAPTREDLKDTPENREVLAKLAIGAEEDLTAGLEAQIKAATTLTEQVYAQIQFASEHLNRPVNYPAGWSVYGYAKEQVQIKEVTFGYEKPLNPNSEEVPYFKVMYLNSRKTPTLRPFLTLQSIKDSLIFYVDAACPPKEVRKRLQTLDSDFAYLYCGPDMDAEKVRHFEEQIQIRKVSSLALPPKTAKRPRSKSARSAPTFSTKSLYGSLYKYRGIGSQASLSSPEKTYYYLTTQESLDDDKARYATEILGLILVRVSQTVLKLIQQNRLTNFVPWAELEPKVEIVVPFAYYAKRLFQIELQSYQHFPASAWKNSKDPFVALISEMNFLYKQAAGKADLHSSFFRRYIYSTKRKEVEEVGEYLRDIVCNRYVILGRVYWPYSGSSDFVKVSNELLEYVDSIYQTRYSNGDPDYDAFLSRFGQLFGTILPGTAPSHLQKKSRKISVAAGSADQE